MIMLSRLKIFYNRYMWFIFYIFIFMQIYTKEAFPCHPLLSYTKIKGLGKPYPQDQRKDKRGLQFIKDRFLWRCFSISIFKCEIHRVIFLFFSKRTIKFCKENFHYFLGLTFFFITVIYLVITKAAYTLHQSYLSFLCLCCGTGQECRRGFYTACGSCRK